MSKDTFYFTHDYNVRSNAKIKRLLLKHGVAGYGVFWAIIEDLYNNANALPLDSECIAYDLRTDADLVHSVIHDFNLFTIDGEIFSSNSVEKRLKEREEKANKARESALVRWGKNANASKNDANALRPECDGNAIKERKGNESKGTKEESNTTGATPPAGVDGVLKGGQEDLETPKPDSVEVKYKKFIVWFNSITKRQFKGDKPSRTAFGARLKEGYTGEDFVKAIKNCLADPYHIDNPHFLTPEFITRSDKLEKYLNHEPAPVAPAKPTNKQTHAELFGYA